MRRRGAAGVVYAAGAVVIGVCGAIGMLTGGRGRMYFGIAIGGVHLVGDCGWPDVLERDLIARSAV
jgi:hypothetical protein